MLACSLASMQRAHTGRHHTSAHAPRKLQSAGLYTSLQSAALYTSLQSDALYTSRALHQRMPNRRPCLTVDAGGRASKQDRCTTSIATAAAQAKGVRVAAGTCHMAPVPLYLVLKQQAYSLICAAARRASSTCCLISRHIHVAQSRKTTRS